MTWSFSLTKRTALARITTSFATDIVPLIKFVGSTPEIRNREIIDNALFNVDNYNSKWVKFINCKFKNFCWANYIDLGVGLYFENCDFDESVRIQGCSARGNDPVFGEPISIKFHNCRLAKFLIFEAPDPAPDLERGVSIKDCTINGGLEIVGIVSSMGSVVIQRSVISTRFEFRAVFVKQSITISNCNVTCRLHIDNLRTGFLSFIKNECKRNLRIWAGEYTQGIVFNGGSYEEDVAIGCIKCPKSLTINGGVFDNGYTVDYQDKSSGLHQGFKEINLRNAHFKNGFFLMESKIWAHHYLNSTLLLSKPLHDWKAIFISLILKSTSFDFMDSTIKQI